MNNLQFRSGHCSTILANPVLNLTPAWRIQLAGPPLRLARPSQSLLPQLHLVRDESHHSSFPASRTMPCRRTPALPRVRATSVPLSSTQQVYQFCGRKRQGPQYLARVRHTPMRCWTGVATQYPTVFGSCAATLLRRSTLGVRGDTSQSALRCPLQQG